MLGVYRDLLIRKPARETNLRVLKYTLLSKFAINISKSFVRPTSKQGRLLKLIRTVNHSKEFVNENGDNTSKIEGHWRQAKCKLPKFGVRKHLFSSYLAEILWQYMYRNEDLFAVFLNDVKKSLCKQLGTQNKCTSR